MPANHTFPTDRPTLTRLLFPAGVPILWSPTLVFYDEAGRIDRGRHLTHLAFMTPHVKGYLLPGSTGDAWEMDEAGALAACSKTQNTASTKISRKGAHRQFWLEITFSRQIGEPLSESV